MAKFKKGDRVRYIREVGDDGVVSGSLGTVDENDSISPYVLWDEADDDRLWPAHESDLELVTKEK